MQIVEPDEVDLEAIEVEEDFLRPRAVSNDDELDITPMIDITFLLLIFFMVSTTFERQALLKVDLPEASEVEDRTEQPETLELVIDSEGRMYLNDRRLVDSEDRTLRAAIEEAVGMERSAPLILRADRTRQEAQRQEGAAATEPARCRHAARLTRQA